MSLSRRTHSWPDKNAVIKSASGQTTILVKAEVVLRKKVSTDSHLLVGLI